MTWAKSPHDGVLLIQQRCEGALHLLYHALKLFPVVVMFLQRCCIFCVPRVAQGQGTLFFCVI
jgi:hypothetical protein